MGSYEYHLDEKYASANNIIEEIQMQKDWSPKTIRTLITRLYKRDL